MSQYVSSMGKVSFEEETTYGTDPATTRDFLGICTSIDHSLTKNPNPIRGIGSRNIRQLAELATDVEVTMELQVQNFHSIYMALGGGSLTAPTEADVLKSFTIERTLDSTNDITYIYTGCVLNSCEWSIAEDDIITASLSFMASRMYRRDLAALTHATPDTERVASFFDGRVYASGTIGTQVTSTDDDEWVFTGDGSTYKDIYLNHIPKTSPEPDIWVDGVIIPVTLGVVEDPDDTTITPGHVYVNTDDGELTFHSDSIPAAGELVTASYDFDSEEISAKIQSISFNINNNLIPIRGIGTKYRTQIAPGGRDYTGSCTFYVQDADQVDWVEKFQKALTLKFTITFGVTAKNFTFTPCVFGDDSSAWSEADVVTEDMSWIGTGLTVS